MDLLSRGGEDGDQVTKSVEDGAGWPMHEHVYAGWFSPGRASATWDEIIGCKGTKRKQIGEQMSTCIVDVGRWGKGLSYRPGLLAKRLVHKSHDQT